MHNGREGHKGCVGALLSQSNPTHTFGRPRCREMASLPHSVYMGSPVASYLFDCLAVATICLLPSVQLPPSFDGRRCLHPLSLRLYV